MWEERFTKPSANDKYIRFYNNRYANGLSKVIIGSPTDKEANVLANCVGYANGRFNEIYSQVTGYEDMRYRELTTNAENFIEKARTLGLKVGNIPQIGAIICWQKGNTLSSGDGAGHVAIVEQVINCSKIITSESGWKATKPWWRSTRTNTLGRWGQASGYKFRGFIYNPCFYSNPYIQPTRSLKYVKKSMMKGDDVKWLQFQLNLKGYSLEVDGVFGSLTDSAVRNFQKKSKLTVDGICGPATKTELLR